MKSFTSLRSICMMLLLCAFLSASAQNVVNEQVQVDNLYYQLYDDATAQVLSSDDYQSLTSVVIPEKVSVEGSEYSVTSLDERAFYGCSDLTSIIIPSSVTSISYAAFAHCSSLTSIDIPGSVTSIGEGAFYQCSNLTDITIPTSVTSIGEGAFYQCSNLTDITIPTSVTSIEGRTFAYCSSLTDITIPNSVTSIGESAFGECISLSDITIPNSVTSIGDYAFFECLSLTIIAIPSSVTSIGEGVFNVCNSLTAFDVDELNTAYCSIDGVLFNKDQTEIIRFPVAKNAQSYSIPTSVTSIGAFAFLESSYLTCIAIPSSVTSIGENAFYWCSNLLAFDVDELNTAYCSIDGVLFNKDQTEIINYPISKTDPSYSLPTSVTSIGFGAFDYCSNLSAIEAGDLNTAFSSIDGILFNKDQTEIVCFPAGKPDPSYSIPTSVTSIGLGAFYSCLNLTSVTIPSTVTSVSNDVFWECYNLTSVICLPTVPPVMENAFDPEYYTNVTLYVPSEAVEAYKTSEYGWSSLLSILPLSEVTHIDLPGTDDEIQLPKTIYTLDGQRTDGTQPGLYIIRQGGKSRKVLMR